MRTISLHIVHCNQLQFLGFQYIITFLVHNCDVKKQYPSYSTRWNSVTSIITLHLGFHQGILSGGESITRHDGFCVVSGVTIGSWLQ